jgi:hypothetical protein
VPRTDFDDGPPTDPEIADELSERLAIDGPPDSAHEVTPTVTVEDACGFCRLVRKLRMADFVPPPANCDEAWAHGTCCGTWDGRWSWCQIRGLRSVDGVVTDCDRRKVARGGLPTGTPERRRAR